MERFERERPHLKPLPTVPYDTSYLEHRMVHWDGFIDVRGNRYSVPAHLCGQMVQIRIGLDQRLRVYAGEALAAEHQLRSAAQGWVSVASHHSGLWQEALQVERRDLSVYEEAGQWN